MANGLSQSANALGNSLGPLIGGSLAALGLRPVFAITTALLLVLGVLMAKFLADASTQKQP
jgi:MFS family permease